MSISSAKFRISALFRAELSAKIMKNRYRFNERPSQYKAHCIHRTDCFFSAEIGVIVSVKFYSLTSRLIPSFSESFIRFSISPPTSLPSLFGGRFITARFCAFGTARFRRQLRCHAVRALCFSCGLPHFIGEALHFSFAECAFYRKRNRVLARAFPYEHSIFLFYVQRYTQTPDLAVNSDPHRGADSVFIFAGVVAVRGDYAVTKDISSTVLLVAGRPQPPQTSAFAIFGIATACI